MGVLVSLTGVDDSLAFLGVLKSLTDVLEAGDFVAGDLMNLTGVVECCFSGDLNLTGVLDFPGDLNLTGVLDFISDLKFSDVLEGDTVGDQLTLTGVLLVAGDLLD